MIEKTNNKEYRVITFCFTFIPISAYHFFRDIVRKDELDTLKDYEYNTKISNISEALTFFTNTFGYTLVSGNCYNNYYIATFIKD